ARRRGTFHDGAALVTSRDREGAGRAPTREIPKGPSAGGADKETAPGRSRLARTTTQTRNAFERTVVREGGQEPAQPDRGGGHPGQWRTYRRTANRGTFTA